MAYNGKLEMERNEGAVRGTIVVAVVVVVACRKEATKTNVPLFTEGKKEKRKEERKEGKVAGIGGTTKFREDRLHSEC